jgi:aconitate hydratase
MVRGTFANIRLRNVLAQGTEGGWTRHLPDGEKMFIYDASVRYQQENISLLIIAGKEYGSGSSRDWAAKGTLLLGVKAVIAESYERIHRSNLVGMGVLPLQFLANENRDTLGLTGEETFAIAGLAAAIDGRTRRATVEASGKRFEVQVRLDTPMEVEYFRNGGILPYVLRQLAAQ